MTIEIKAKEIKLVDINKIHPWVKNVNKHPDDQIENFIKIIEYQGFTTPIEVENETMDIVVGHGRYLAAKKLKMTHVPVIFRDYKDYDQKWLRMVSDNAIANRAEIELKFVNEGLEEVGPFDIELLGLKDFKIEPAELPEKKERKQTQCPNCGEKF